MKNLQGLLTHLRLLLGMGSDNQDLCQTHCSNAQLDRACVDGKVGGGFDQIYVLLRNCAGLVANIVLGTDI